MLERQVTGEKVNANDTEHLARIEGTLARVFRRNGYEGVTSRTPFSSLLDKEEGRAEGEFGADEELEIRVNAFRILLRYIFADGPHPGKSMRRVYVLARAFEPELIAQMNGTDLAVIFNEERATQSARVKRMFNQTLAANGGRKDSKLPFQKAAAACRKMASAQQGNQNRRGSKVARAARAKQNAQ